MPIDFRKHTPTTLTEAVDLIVGSLEEGETDAIRWTDTMAVFHYGFGRDMRNGWKLWQDTSPLSQFFKETYKVTHADDMSGMILDAVQAKVRGREFDAQGEADKYIKYWADQKSGTTKVYTF